MPARAASPAARATAPETSEPDAKNQFGEQEGLRRRVADSDKPKDGEADANQKEGEDIEAEEAASDLTGEYGNIALLLVLYTLQGLPMGLSAVLPLVLKERGASFSELGTFSLNSWPFSLKLLWAPIVDTVYLGSLGRRKTWMVPSQILIGVVMLGLSVLIDDLLYADKPAINTLTGLFFLLYFLCATQDIAVDGWALTMLRKENVGWAATCNAAGQTLGYALGFTGYMMLEQYNIVRLSSFMFASGIVFLVVTAVVAVFKDEKPVPPEQEPEDIATSYKQMMSLLKLKPVQSLIVILASWKMAFAVTDAVAPLKFQEYGIPKHHMAYMTSLLMPMYIALPIIAARWTSGPQPMDLAMQCYPWRVMLAPLGAVLAHFTPASVEPLPYGFYSILLIFGTVGAIASEFMFVAQMAFFTRISDPAIGGTYMTMLNTLGNLGGKWPPTVTFFLVDKLSCKQDECLYRRDGFYVMSVLCGVIGLVWYAIGNPQVRALERRNLDDWKVTKDD